MAAKKRKRKDDTEPSSGDKTKILVLCALWIGTAVFLAVWHLDRIFSDMASGDYTLVSIIGLCIGLAVFFTGFALSRFVRVMYMAVLAALVSLIFGFSAVNGFAGGFGVIGDGLIALVAGIGALMAVHDAFTWDG